MFNLFKKKNTKPNSPTLDEILKIQNETEKVIALHKFCNRNIGHITETERLINAVEDFESDVMNGGFDQYLTNKTKPEQQDALLGLEKIGARKSLELFKKALPLFAEEQLDALDVLDKEFFAYEDNIQALVIKYAEMHKNDFSK